MNTTVLEILIIAILLVANGVFAMTEMALVSSRKARLKSLAEKGNKDAAVALDLAESPNRFLSTVQIGITLIGIFAGAFGGATIAKEIATALVSVPVIGEYGAQIGVVVVVVTLTFFSLVVGELVPKRLALQRPEAISMIMARPMHFLSGVASPLIRVLSFATEAILRLLRVHEHKHAPVTEEDVTGMVREGLDAGVFHPHESKMVARVMALDRLRVRDIMTPRTRIVWIGADDSHDKAWHKIVVSHHSHFPIYEGRTDYVLGVVSVKSIYANLAAGALVHLRDLMTPALTVSEMVSASHLLDTFKRQGLHIAFAIDEYGGVSGVVTINDILESIVGEVSDMGKPRRSPFVRREDGSFLVDALVGTEELREYFPAFRLSEEEDRKYSTLGGFVCEQLGRIPAEGEHFELQGFRFEVVDMDRQRVDKVLVSVLPPVQEENSDSNIK